MKNDKPLTCYELQKYMASQPPDRPIVFFYGEIPLTLHECYPTKTEYIIELQDQLPVIERGKIENNDQ